MHRIWTPEEQVWIKKLEEMEQVETDKEYLAWWKPLPPEIRKMLAGYKHSRSNMGWFNKLSPEAQAIISQHHSEAHTGWFNKLSPEAQETCSKNISIAKMGNQNAEGWFDRKSPEAQEVLRQNHSEASMGNHYAKGWLDKLPPEDQEAWRQKCSEAYKDWLNSLPPEEQEAFRQNNREITKKAWTEGKYDNRKYPSKRDGWEKWVEGQLKGIGISFKRQVRFPTSLGSYTADFYLPDSDEYLEIKGSYWETDLQKAKIKELRGEGHIIHYLVDEAIGDWLNTRR